MDFADAAHGDQMRKYTPERYIVHPVRVMKHCMEHTNDICILAAALLHDVLEDTPVTAEEISGFLSQYLSPEQVQRTIRIIIELTDVYVKEKYPGMNREPGKRKKIKG